MKSYFTTTIFLFILTSKSNALNCIDANNMLIPNATCTSIAVDKNSKFSINLLEPSLNYCKSGTNATTDLFCQGLLPNQLKRVSGFTDYSNNETSYEQFINIMFLIILICVVISISIQYKDKILKHSLFDGCKDI